MNATPHNGHLEIPHYLKVFIGGNFKTTAVKYYQKEKSLWIILALDSVPQGLVTRITISCNFTKTFFLLVGVFLHRAFNSTYATRDILLICKIS